MNERTTLEKIAPTVEEAIAAGLVELGLPEDSVDVEVLDNGSRGLFGVGSRQARVRLTVKAYLTDGETREGNKAQTKLPAVSSEAEGSSQELTDEAFSVLDDNLLFVSRQTVADLLEKMHVDAHIEVRYGEPDEENQRPVLVDIQGDLGETEFFTCIPEMVFTHEEQVQHGIGLDEIDP